MNRYGSMAQSHWRQFLPARCATITDPQSFFSTLGDQVSQRVAALQDELLSRQPTPVDEEHFAMVGRRNMAKLQAEEVVLAELVLLEPESETQAALDEREEPLPEEWRMPQDWQLAALEDSEQPASAASGRIE